MQVTRFGGPDVMRVAEVERPSPISTEVLVRVVAAGVNPVDCKTRRGDGVSRWLGPPPFVVGWDVAGVVEAMGYGVTRFEVGDRVFGMPRFPRAAGAYAEYVTAPSRQFARLPEGTSMVEAASLPLAWLTAWQCLVETANLQSGQTVLIHGAAGGVGQLAVQVANAQDAQVVLDALETRDADVALDLVGGRDTLRLVATIRPGGMLLAVADGADDAVKAEAARLGVVVREPLVEPDGHALELAARMLEDGTLEANVRETFPLERAAAAHERLEKGGVRGKLVLEVGDD